MGANTLIEWADHTWNAWEGCTKVSPGCANCYAAARDERFTGGKHWGPGAPRRLTSLANWLQVARWNRLAAIEGNRPRVFVNSLADILDPEVDPIWLAKLLDVVRMDTHLDFLLLTKRPELWEERLQAAHDAMCLINPALTCWISDWIEGTAPANVWMGTTVEDQQRAGERIPALLSIPARVRFLSCEPLLGPVDLAKAGAIWSDMNNTPIDARHLKQYLHWVICGGESGHGARPMHPDWARALRDQCAASGVAFFFKQWGEYLPAGQFLPNHGKISGGTATGVNGRMKLHYDNGNLVYADKGVDSAAVEGLLTFRVGKSAAGRLLDGVEHNAFPEVQS